MSKSIEQKALTVLQAMSADGRLGQLVRTDLPLPRAFGVSGGNSIRLIVLGQDPTVKNPRSKPAKVTLNLDNEHGSLFCYLDRICGLLDKDLDLRQHVYATNFFKNFFISPPAGIKEIDVLAEATRYWLPLLQEELAAWPHLPVVSLGEPLLRVLVASRHKPKLRDCWGYQKGWRKAGTLPPWHLCPQDNILGRHVFPFPHQPAVYNPNLPCSKFYSPHLATYASYVRYRLAERPV